MSVRGLVTVVIGVVAFVVIIQNLLRVIVAAAILIGVVMSIGGQGRK
jgi:hypothetical protein